MQMVYKNAVLEFRRAYFGDLKPNLRSAWSALECAPPGLSRQVGCEDPAARSEDMQASRQRAQEQGRRKDLSVKRVLGVCKTGPPTYMRARSA